MNDNLINEFKLQKNMCYLNHAGVSPWPLRTSKAAKDFAEENMLMGSARYLQWLEVEDNLKSQAAELINAQSKDDIALLKNTSEALSLVAYGLDFNEGDNIVSSNQEFPSNRIVWESLAQRGVEFREADLDDAESPEDALFSITDSHTRLITISSVQYSTGLRMDLKRIGEECKKRGILFCVDSIQSLGAIRFDVNDIQADFIMADSHKWMFGPEGIAIFYCRPEARELLGLNQYGWHMIEAAGDFDRREWEVAKTSRRFECGSPNMLGIHALNASLSLLHEAGMDTIEKEVLKRSEYLFDLIGSTPEIKLITPFAPNRYAGIVTFIRKDKDNAALYEKLMQLNVICAYRSGGIRLSPHFYTPYAQLDRAIQLIMEF